MTTTILIGDVRKQLRLLPAEHFDCVVTSPPYWGLRDYGVAGQIGLEPTLGEHIETIVDVCREIRRVLKRGGTFWLNYGDCYAAAPNGKSAAAYKADGSDDRTFRDKPFSTVGAIYVPDYEKSARMSDAENLGSTAAAHGGRIVGLGRFDPNYSRSPREHFVASDRQSRLEAAGRVVAGGYLKPKDLCMIPNRIAIALQDDGWWVRSEIIWHKPNPMPESVYDRPTSAHEKIWLLTKSEDYYYNHEAIREPVSGGTHARMAQNIAAQKGSSRAYGGTKTMKAGLRKAGANSRENVDRVPRGRKVPAGWDTGEGFHGNSNKHGRNTPGGPKVAVAEENAVDRGKRAHFGQLADAPISKSGNKERKLREDHGGFSGRNSKQGYGVPWEGSTRNSRNVWTIAPKAFREAHFATFPPALAERCIKAGVPPTTCSLCGEAKLPEECGGMCASLPRARGRVLDPFGGAGTVGLVAEQLGLDCTLIELNPEYAEIARRRLYGDAPEAEAAQ